MSAHLALAAATLLSLAAARPNAGSRSREQWAITKLTGQEVFSHVTTPSAAASILRQGFRPGRGRHGPGVYLLPPGEIWGGGLPPSRTPAHEFRLAWHHGPVSVLRVSLPFGARLLRVSGPEVVRDAYKLLEGPGAYKEALRERPAWEDGDDSQDALLLALAKKWRIDGLYITDIWQQGEILIFDAGSICVLGE